VAQDLLGIGRRSGYEREMAWLTEILQWPVRWSSLHGVAIVTTPVLKVVSSTTPLSEKMVIDLEGSWYPEEGARGTQFPFKDVQPLIVRRTNDWAQNGFASWSAQEDAHGVILALVAQTHPTASKVLDLGCGNGRLLEKIVQGLPWMSPCGVESDQTRYATAAVRFMISEIYNCSIHDEHFWNGPYGLALISVNRFDECGDEAAGKLLMRLAQNCEYVIFYTYGNAKGFMIPGFFEEISNLSRVGQDTAATLVRSRRP